MDDLNKNKNLEVRGAGGGGGGGKSKVEQNVTVIAPTRQPVIAEDNLFSVAFAKTVYAISEGVVEGRGALARVRHGPCRPPINRR